MPRDLHILEAAQGQFFNPSNSASFHATYLALTAAIGVPIVSREVRLVPHSDDLDEARRLELGEESREFIFQELAWLPLQRN